MAEPATRADALRVEVASVEVQHLTPAGTVAGIRIDAVAARNGPGVAMLQVVPPNLLSWKGPSGSYGPGVDVSQAGSYLVEDGGDPGKWARVTSVPAFLPSAEEVRVYLQDRFENEVADDDVTAAEASAGDTKTWTLTLSNDSSFGLSDVKAWIDASVSDIEISDDGATWVTPTSETHGDVLTWGMISAGGSETLHVRRTIAAATSSDPDILNLFHFAWNGL